MRLARHILLGCSVVFLVVAVAAFCATFTPSYQQCDTSYQEHDGDNKKANLNLRVPASSPMPKNGIARFLRCEGTAIDANSATLTAIATVFLTLITGVLAWLAYRENATTRAQLRAYVSVEIASSPPIRQKGTLRFEFRPDIVNNGQTPAKRLEVLSRIDVSEFAVPKNFDYRIPPNPPGNLKSVTTLGVGMKRFHHCIIQRALTRDELRKLAKAKLAFHIWGTVTYFDIFDVKHFTNFSYVILLPVSKRVLAIWHTTEHHNDAD
jgi:hypothetical protein